jgi:hypothetical protein
MATADELLAGLTNYSDSDTTLVIDNYLRTIIIPKAITNLGVESDDDVLRLNFKMPRYLDDTDLSKFSIRINYLNAQGEGDVYTVRDTVVGANSMTFSWLVGPTATAYKGNTKFNVCMKITDSDGIVEKEYNTTIATLPVLEGLEVDEAVVSEYSDILEQWKNELFGIGDTEEASMRAVSAQEQENIVKKGEEVLATIPEEYQETVKAAQEGIRTKADAIICSAEGREVIVSDSSDDYVRGLRVFGKTTQITTTGKNLVNLLEVIVKPETGYNYDLFTGTAGQATPVSPEYFDRLPYLTVGTYYLNAEFDPGVANTEIKVMAVTDDGSTSTASILTTKSGPFTVSTDTRVTIRLGTSTAAVIRRIQIESGDHYTGYEPYSGGKASPSPEYTQPLTHVGDHHIAFTGKNIWPVDHIELTGGSLNEDILNGPIHLPVTMSWTQDFARTTGSAMFSYVVDGKTYFTASAETPGRFVHVINGPGVLERITLVNWAPETGNLIDIQVEYGTKATTYEPYRDVQQITVQHTLPGVPVTAGGNYTDENGQQWICDEIDFERGVYVQRIKTTEFSRISTYLNVSAIDGSGVFFTGVDGYDRSSKTLGMLSPTLRFYGPVVHNGDAVAKLKHGEFAYLPSTESASRIYFAISGVTSEAEATTWIEANRPIIQFPLKTPIETPLTAEEIAGYKALKTNYPNTTVFNDTRAHMELKYNADTKTWINNLLGDGPALKSTTITLYANKWTMNDSVYSQVVTVNGVTANSKIDLQPSPDQLSILMEEDVSLTTSNDNGVITVYAIGATPSVDMTMQVLITEVVQV